LWKLRFLDIWYRFRGRLVWWLLRRVVRNPLSCDHQWSVVACVLSDGSLDVQCDRCLLWGSVEDPTEEEWTKATRALENPYPWAEPERVRYDPHQ